MLKSHALRSISFISTASRLVSYQDRQYPLRARAGACSRLRVKDKTITTLKRWIKRAGENYAADHNIGKQGIERYYENDLRKTGKLSGGRGNHGRIVRSLKDAFLPVVRTFT